MGFIADIWSAKQSSKAQTKASNQSIAEQKRQYDLSRADQMPWLTAGSNALGQMGKLNSGDFSSFQASPDYAWTLSEGMKGLDRSAASRGRLYSGGYGEDLTRYAQGAASTQYNNYYNKLQSMADQGQTTTNQLGSLGQNYANQYSTNKYNLANSRSTAYGKYAQGAQDGLDAIGKAIGGGW